MQKRVLAFLMVLAMVFSLLPVSLVGAEEAAKDPGYVMITQKAHNQTDGSLAIDIYLQANTAGQADVSGYQFTVVPAEGVTVTGAVDATGNDGLAGSGNTFIYTPGSAALAVGTGRVLVATVTVTAETLPAQAGDAITLTEATVTTSEAAFVPTFATKAVNDTWAGVEGEWKPATAADLTVAKLPAGNYYLVENVSTDKTITIDDDNAVVNIDLNGYTLTSTARILNLDANGTDVTISDCTASGEGADMTAGKIVLKKYSWGNFRQSVADTKLTVTNVIIEGAEDAVSHTKDPAKDANTGNAAAFYQATAAAGSTLLVENVLFRDIDAGKTVNDIRAEGTFKDCTFVKVNGGSQMFNIGKDTEYTDDLAIFVLNGNPAASGTRALTIDGCEFIDCDDEILDTNNKSVITYTLKGDVRAEGAFYVTKTCKLNLELGANADVTIRTEQDKTEETLGENIVIPEGATVTAGTVLYDNTGSFVTYKNGAFTFSTHAHDDVSFKAWDDSKALPTEGSWYLTTDVTINCTRYVIGRGETLNLDLNGHTIRQTKVDSGIYSVEGFFNLYDCAEEYDAEGNWIGGQLTGGTQQYGGAVGVQRGQVGEAEELRPTFNMYGGRLAGNNAAKSTDGSGSGGAVYIASSLAAASGNQWGGVFNMYGGEIYGNQAGTLGTAVTAWGFSPTASSGSKGVAKDLGMGATFNMYGGKIHGNNKTLDSKTYVDGTVNVTMDAIFNMSGGEICNNHVERGGAVYVNSVHSTVNITGGKIYGNSAVESAAKRNLFTDAADGKSTTFYNGAGGALFISGGTVTIKDAVISENYGTRGGAVYAANGTNTTVTIENSIIDGNYSVNHRTAAQDALGKVPNVQEWGNGGAFYLTTEKTTVTLKGCEITNNRATKDSSDTASKYDYCGVGGAIYANYIKNLTIEDCTFTGNNCEKESGGAMYLRNGAVADVKGCTFTDNTANTAGGALYTLGNSVLKLTDTVVTGNSVKSTLSAVYVTSDTGRLVLSGKVVIAGNTNSKSADGGNNQQDLVFQGQAKRTELMEVNQLGDGSHVNLYFYNKDSSVTKNGLASGYVKISTETGAKQEEWDCGWITVFTGSTDAGKNVSYVNDEFTFGHWHKMPDGTMQEFTAHTATTAPTAAGYYYMSKDIVASAAWVISTDNIHFCFNGKQLSSAKGPAIKVGDGNTAGITLNVYDCTATYENETYVGGGLSGTNGTFGRGVYVCRATTQSNTLNWYGGGIHDCNATTTGTGGTGGAALYTQAKNTAAPFSPVVNWYNGAIYDNTSTVPATCTAGVSTAVISNNCVKMTIHDGLFYNNHTDNGRNADNYGGLIYNVGPLYVKGGLFKNNSAEYAGGAIYNTGNAYITGGKFVGNFVKPDTKGGWGGAIYNANSGNILSVKGTAENPVIFEGNYAERLATTADGKTTYSNGNGGAIELMNGQDSVFEYVHFINNSANNGGALYAGGGSGTTKTTMSNCYFSGNEAITNGGAFYLNRGNTTMTNNVFEDNYAGDRGGAMWGTTNTNYNVSLTGDVFKNNESKNYAGAFYVANNIQLTMNGVQFIGNSTTSWGGAIYTANSALTINATNCLFEGNSAKNGGALAHDWGKTLTYLGCTFKDNVATNGGAAYLRGNDAAVITFGGAGDDGCTFIGNQATTAGAVLATSNTHKVDNVDVYYNPTHKIINCTFTENVATNDTSAVKSVGAARLTVTDCTITGNTSKIYGALHLAHNNAALTLTGKMIVTDNVSTSYEAYAENCDLYMQNYNENGITNGFVDVSGLTEGSKIGVHMAENRAYNDDIFTQNGGAAMKDYFFANSEQMFTLVTKDGELALVKYVAEDGSAYGSLEEAIAAEIAAGKTTVTLQHDSTAEDIELGADLTIDLNGFDMDVINVAEGKTLTLIDSKTNDYDVADGDFGTVKTVNGAYNATAEVNNKDYVVLADEDGKLSAHRVYLSINYKTLRPACDGVGFKAIFAGDEMVVAAGVTFGIQLTGYENFSAYASASFDDMVAGIGNGKTPNQKTVVVTKAITPENQSRWDANVYGRPFITVGDQTITGTVQTVNMKSMAANALNSGDEVIIAAVNEMLARCGVSVN